MKYSELLIKNKELERSVGGPLYTITVLSNITVQPLKDILEYTLRSESINAQVGFGDYDNIVQNSGNFNGSNAVFIFWELSNLVEGLQYKANVMSQESVQELIDEVKSEMDLVYSNLKDFSLVFMNSFSTLPFNYANLKKDTFDSICDVLNEHLSGWHSPGVHIVDQERVLAKVSVEKSIDLRFFYSSKSLYTVDFWKEYSAYVKPLILSAYGKSKKMLVFDCDNTLWKGILGEDGPDNIAMSSEKPQGVPFEEVQSLALALHKKGILLGLCSKNNPEDVEAILDDHGEMVLKKDNFTVRKVNWEDKVVNLESIAEELNIGLDSMVFVDDSDFEVNRIKGGLPDLTVLQVPSKTCAYPKLMREHLGLFFSLSESMEDQQKSKMYSQQRKRTQERKIFASVEEYLQSLEMKMKVFPDCHTLIPRLSQMTLKTNQFNLTTKRYTEPDIKSFIDSSSSLVLCFSLADKFGDTGITGLSIIEITARVAKIDTFLMSCRVIGRNIEYAFFDTIMSLLKKTEVASVQGVYNKTLKNCQVEDFFETLGFSLESSLPSNKTYTIRLKDYRQKNINYIKVEHGK